MTTLTTTDFYGGADPTHVEVTDPQAFGLWAHNVTPGQVLSVREVRRPMAGLIGACPTLLTVEHPRFLGVENVSIAVAPHRVGLLVQP